MSLSITNENLNKSGINFRWMATHFATAMGIGVLFVPQEIGPQTIGFSSFLIMIAICIPIAYLNHKTLSGLIIFGGNGEGSVLTIRSMAGKKASLLYSFLLLISSLSICIINFIALVSAISQTVPAEYTEIVRVISSISISALIYALSSRNHQKIVAVTKYISIPLSLVLIGTSLFLIPFWDWAILSANSDINVREIITFIPIIVFAMNFTPCVSMYIESTIRKKDNDKIACEKETSMTLLASCIAIAITVMFFSFSVSMALDSSMLENMGKNTNSISLISQLLGGGVFQVIGLMIVATASFGALMGTLIGVQDGLKHFSFSQHISDKKLMLFVCCLLALVGILNPNIIDLIKLISGPSVIAVGMLIPAFIMLKNKHFKCIYFMAIVISLITLLPGYLI